MAEMWTARQSHLRSFSVCPRRAVMEVETPQDLTVGNVGASADLGTFIHIVIYRCMKALVKHDQSQMSTIDMDALIDETYASVNIVLSTSDMADARWMLYRFCEIEWNPRRIIGLETPYETDLVCSDGVIRKFTGRPDIVYSDPPYGIICADPKSGRAKPRMPREFPPSGEPIIGREYLSDRGHYQGSAYALLLAANHPTARYVIFRELPLRFPGPPHDVYLSRQQIEEHVRPHIAADMMKLDQALRDPESDLRRPRPGKQCARACPVSLSCPVPREQRGEGVLETVEQAAAAADAWTVARAQVDALRAQLKAYHEAGGVARASDGRVARWDPPVGKGRKFDLHEPLTSDEVRVRRVASLREALAHEAAPDVVEQIWEEIEMLEGTV